MKERTAFAEALQHAFAEVESLKNRPQAENVYLQDEIKLEHNFGDIISRSEALKKVLRKVLRVLLENVIARAVIVSQGKQLKLDDWLPNTAARLDEPTIVTLEDMERHHILKILEQTGWRISGARGAAKMLNINASTLRSRMEKLGIKK